MSQEFRGWKAVANHLRAVADSNSMELNQGQKASLLEIAKRLPKNGVIIADEVGMGKTRIATAVARSVIAEGGRVAILVPPGLGYQWCDELRIAGVNAPLILRSLWQYLQAWATPGQDVPWFKEAALVISHSFTNWRFGESTAAWRWSLLPALYARWRKLSSGRWPRDYCKNKILNDALVRKASESIVGAMSGTPAGHPTRRFIQELTEKTPWPGALVPEEYKRNALLRPWLERAVGLGLGVFDLVVIDEAHKCRGQESGLNRLINEVVLRSAEARSLAMTATPVELDAAQWTQMLGRISVDEVSKVAATTAISNYAQAVVRVRQCLSNQIARDEYKTATKTFQEALNPYLLRRDKREDPAVLLFKERSGEGFHAYRREREISIDTARLTPDWKSTVCAAEALSFVSRQSDNTAAKRLRLTLGNGHGIAALIDQWQRDDKDDHKQMEADGASETTIQRGVESEPSTDKRLQRTEWWQNVMIQPFAKDGSALFNHPAILAAVEEIERVCRQEEKVLVFGRFTRPLRALVQLLNAREMLRCLEEKRPWPQSKVHGDEEWSAILAAHKQLKISEKLERRLLDDTLAGQYQTLEKQRRSIREILIGQIEEGLKKKQSEDRPTDPQVRDLFEAFKKSAAQLSEKGRGKDENALAIVARAIQELIGAGIENALNTDFAQAFADLVAAASDRDEGDKDSNGGLGEGKASGLWEDLIIRLKEEFYRPEGGYARLMYGETKPATRRLLQLAFNRKQGHPRVLVAQSLVGREGLNLHRACRTVVLLHPEWNPGVVEQQIGRIDRIGSLWEEQLNQVVGDKQTVNELPRIEIRPVVFHGTYDGKNWQVLRGRWDDLRAQLHGIVISSGIAEKYPSAKQLVAEINDAAPNFSPLNSGTKPERGFIRE